MPCTKAERSVQRNAHSLQPQCRNTCTAISNGGCAPSRRKPTIDGVVVARFMDQRNYDTWIGEPEENKAWSTCCRCGRILGSRALAPRSPAQSPLVREHVNGLPPWRGRDVRSRGSDWFWWYGADQTAPAGDRPFDSAFLIHLNNVYTFARRAGAEMPQRSFEPIIAGAGGESSVGSTGKGTMARSAGQMQKVLFRCEPVVSPSRSHLHHRELENWVPGSRTWSPSVTTALRVIKRRAPICRSRSSSPWERQCSMCYTTGGRPEELAYLVNRFLPAKTRSAFGGPRAIGYNNTTINSAFQLSTIHLVGESP